MILTTLHLFREERKLDSMAASLEANINGDLAPILAQLGRWLGWAKWDWRAGQYYGYEIKAAADFGFEDCKSIPCPTRVLHTATRGDLGLNPPGPLHIVA